MTTSPFQDHATPLAFATTTGATYDADDGDDDYIIRPRGLLCRHHRRRLCLACAGLCCALLVIVALVLLVLALTVFKVKEPVVTMNSVTISNLSLSSPSPLAPVSINLTAVADISVRNPNAASFVFGAAATTVYYRGHVLAVAYSPAGAAPAHGSFTMEVTVKVMVDHVLGDPALVGDVAAGSIAVTTKTEVGGRVKVLGVFRHHVDVRLECSMTVALSSQAITDQSCSQKVSL